MIIELFAAQNRKQLVLRRGRERAVANRHPWIFGGAIAHESGPDDAAIADLVDERGNVLASGFHSPHSQIRLRALTFGDEVLSTAPRKKVSESCGGDPPSASLPLLDDVPASPRRGASHLSGRRSQSPDTFFRGAVLSADVIRERIATAIARRSSLSTDETNALRLVNAEGDELSGLVVDRYHDLVVVEIANYGVEQLKPLVIEAIREALAPRVIFFKNDIPVRKIERLSLENEWDGGGEPAATIRESGLSFVVEPAEGQKTGFFLDQRENRRIARTIANGTRMLNLFSYSGAFGVYAAAGGATSVVNVDVSERAIALARTNHEMNGFGADFVVADAFDWIRKTSAPFDLVVCDPPAFAKSRGDIDRAARGYKDINLQSLKHVAPGGMLMTFSCSGHLSLDLFQKVIFAAATDAGRRASIVRRLTAGPDHPISIYCPEGEYLKGFLLSVV